ncbi:hypothetical protein CRV03_03190 [Arcobacter sp. F155]|uniref:PglD-related sugar-binding protein n=1 Tax=Arcobacter sp. F155 TaxID=2044512 RepID=UPI00102662FF|nr:hypothetical protein [Arcobacter sp. F155]RXJ77989.1 hypothetical protein CRV03_03190 [Arcobacter sp. F155]
MGKSIYIYGTSSQRLVSADIASSCGYDDIIFVDDEENEYPSFDDIKRTNGIYMTFAICSNAIRAKLYEKVQSNGFEIVSLIHPSVIIFPSATIGKGTCDAKCSSKCKSCHM